MILLIRSTKKPNSLIERTIILDLRSTENFPASNYYVNELEVIAEQQPQAPRFSTWKTSFKAWLGLRFQIWKFTVDDGYFSRWLTNFEIGLLIQSNNFNLWGRRPRLPESNCTFPEWTNYIRSWVNAEGMWWNGPKYTHCEWWCRGEGFFNEFELTNKT